MDIKNKVIVITGGGQGLGRSMATVLASKGAKLALIDLDKSTLDISVDQCKEHGVDAKAYIANVSNEQQVIDIFDQIVEDFGGINVLINNAGILRDGLLIKAQDGKVTKKLSLAEWQAVIDVNLTGVFLCGREAAERMVNLGNEGVIINISSISRNGNPGQTNYSAAKSGVVAMTKTWAKELARYKIRAAAIAPGMMATDMTANMKPEALERATSFIPLGHLGSPQNIAHGCAFIIENDYFTGRILEIDGGL
jgi:3-oxoacyl-[acyl-carrier protein] reductase